MHVPDDLSPAARQEIRYLIDELDRASHPLVKRNIERSIAERITRAARRKRRPYTTDYAVAWAKKQGWRIVERERWDAALRRHHDLAGGSDVCAIDQDRRRVWIQGARPGKTERDVHMARFEARRAQLAQGERYVYVTFERGSAKPVAVEEWTA